MYKVFSEDGRDENGIWSLPTRNSDDTWLPGKWMPTIEGELVQYENGYHLCREGDLLGRLEPMIYEAEYRGDMLGADNKIVVRLPRLLRRCDGWNKNTIWLFGCDCAERALSIYEYDDPDDKRLRQFVDAIRQYVKGEVTKDQLTAIGEAFRIPAWYAAPSTAKDAARDAAWYAAQGAVREAAWSAAWAVGWAAAQGVVRNPRCTVRGVAGDVWKTVKAAVEDAEKQWQTAHLVRLLEG